MGRGRRITRPLRHHPSKSRFHGTVHQRSEEMSTNRFRQNNDKRAKSILPRASRGFPVLNEKYPLTRMCCCSTCWCSHKAHPHPRTDKNRAGRCPREGSGKSDWFKTIPARKTTIQHVLGVIAGRDETKRDKLRACTIIPSTVVLSSSNRSILRRDIIYNVEGIASNVEGVGTWTRETSSYLIVCRPDREPNSPLSVRHRIAGDDRSHGLNKRNPSDLAPEHLVVCHA